MGDVTHTLADINRNPLNLRPLPSGERWQGQTGVSSNSVTGGFCQFVTNVKGVRAAVINMRSIVRLGRRSISDVIYTWAPPPPKGITGTAGSAVDGVDQNHTEAYVASVCKYAGIPRTYSLAWLGTADTADDQDQYEQLAKIVRGMNIVEAGGSTVSEEDVIAGIGEAVNLPVGYRRQDTGNVVRTDINQSETVKQADTGTMQTMLATGAGVVGPVVGSVAGLSWQIVAIMAGAAVIILGGLAIYNLLKIKAERVKQHEEGIV